jgi:hypothetical protein
MKNGRSPKHARGTCEAAIKQGIYWKFVEPRHYQLALPLTHIRFGNFFDDLHLNGHKC